VKRSLHTESEINQRRIIGGSNAHVIIGRAPDARPSPTFSSVEEAHTGLIERLAGSKPHRILYIADARDHAPNISNRSLAQCSTMSAPS
jgi:hypothetical protein